MTEAERQRQEALKAAGAFGAATFSVPLGVGLPLINFLGDTSKIKKQEAMRMFPQADPNMFSVTKYSDSPSIPLSQREASSLVFKKNISPSSPLSISNIYRGEQFLPTYLTGRPGAPSPELGSYQQAILNKEMFPEGSIQALTVTPAPNPGRFAKDYAEVLADKLGKTINEREFVDQNWDPIGEFKDPLKLQSKIEQLRSKIPGTAGYVWGNIDSPQYSYAEGNWGLGQKEKGINPSLYASRISADPLKEADYLYTGNVLTGEGVDPRVTFKRYADLGPATGPSYGIAPNDDISFRKDLIAARGELTTGDLQALLAERNLPFDYQTAETELVKRGDKRVPRTYTSKKPGDILRKNLEQLAKAENITPSQAIEKFSRLVPNVGEPATPPTAAVTGRVGAFPVEGQAISPAGRFASKTDLRQIGILPPADKATYSAFKVDEMDKTFKYIYPRYDASFTRLNTYSSPINPLDLFGEAEKGLSELVINRNKLRPQAANKLLDRTVTNLINQSKPIQGLGLGGFVTGGISTVMDPAVIDALSSGDYNQAGTTAAINTAIGSAVGGATAKTLQGLQAAGYARPAAAIGATLPAAGGVLAGLGAIETGKALNRAYKAQTGKDWVKRNQPAPRAAYTGPTPTIQPRMGTAILGGKEIQVPYGSVAGQRKVGRPWWDRAGTQFQNLLNSFSPAIGR
jgi:hypothetical protein